MVVARAHDVRSAGHRLAAYGAVGALGVDIGLEWGGSWKTIVDAPHFQLRPEWAADMAEKQMLAELRARRENESPVYA